MTREYLQYLPLQGWVDLMETTRCTSLTVNDDALPWITLLTDIHNNNPA
jgi:hypothetical protein